MESTSSNPIEDAHSSQTAVEYQVANPEGLRKESENLKEKLRRWMQLP